MNREEDYSEYRDDVTDLYQYRPGNRGTFNQVKRSSYSQPRTNMLFSDLKIGNNNSNIPSGQALRKRFSDLPRSKSFGRDARLTDLMKTYPSQNRPEQAVGPYDDALSKDSGHSSAGTPDFAWRRREISRGSSFPQPTCHESAEDFSQVDTMSLYGRLTDPDRDRQDLDTRSVHSLDSHLLNWSCRPKLSAKRKYSTFDEAISSEDDVDHEKVAKRQKTPERYVNEYTASEDSVLWSFIKRTLNICYKIFCISFLLVILLVCFASFKNWQCSVNRAQSLDTDRISEDLSSNVFGQKLAVSEIVSGIKLFTESDLPLIVLVLFGWLGTGKTHTANLLSSFLPIQSNSHYITCSLPSSISNIPNKVAHSCGYSLVVLDDIESADKDTIDILEKLLVTIHNEPNSKSNGTIVVATTSAGGHSVNKLLLEMSKSSLTSRDTLTTAKILSVLESEEVTIPLYRTMLEYNIPVKLVPFLPLNRSHLRKCAIRLAKAQGFRISDMQVNMVLDQMQYFSQELPIFAKTGCKHISSKLDLLVGSGF